jgi:hypothetical protein
MVTGICAGLKRSGEIALDQIFRSLCRSPDNDRDILSGE